jgi:superoxide reductase
MLRRRFLTAAGVVGASQFVVGRSAVQAAEGSVEKRGQIYKCEQCGTIVEVLEPGDASLVHCGKPMKLEPELTQGAGAPKHIPVIEKVDGGYKVKVGAAAHPMQKAHHIAWIELIADGQSHRRYLETDKPAEAVFMLRADNVSARAYCNLHGLWKSV